jgi:hypothetical protein
VEPVWREPQRLVVTPGLRVACCCPLCFVSSRCGCPAPLSSPLPPATHALLHPQPAPATSHSTCLAKLIQPNNPPPTTPQAEQLRREAARLRELEAARASLTARCEDLQAALAAAVARAERAEGEAASLKVGPPLPPLRSASLPPFAVGGYARWLGHSAQAAPVRCC